MESVDNGDHCRPLAPDNDDNRCVIALCGYSRFTCKAEHGVYAPYEEVQPLKFYQKAMGALGSIGSAMTRSKSPERSDKVCNVCNVSLLVRVGHDAQQVARALRQGRALIPKPQTLYPTP